MQPLMLRLAFDAIERDGVLFFRMRQGQSAVALGREMLAVSSELDATIEQTRASAADAAGRVRLRFVQADGNFDALAEESVLAEAGSHAVSTSEMPLVLTRGEGQQIVERWLAESRVARETVRFALPPSCMTLGAGDVISLPADQGEGKAFYRIDKVEQGALQLVEAVRIEHEVYQSIDIVEDTGTALPFIAPLPVLPLFLDLPLISGDEVPHAPFVAVTADPWPGGAAVYRSFTDANFGLLNVVSKRATVGQTLTEMVRAPSGRFDNGPALEIKLTSGVLSSVEEQALMSGANLAAIGDGSPDGWEVFQFAGAELFDDKAYRLSRRLRGQLGTDALMPDVWPAGSWFVLLNGAMEQVGLSRSERGVEQTFRIGPSTRPLEDPVFVQQTHVFQGNGLRPYAPVHLNRKAHESGDVSFVWVRRTREDGDSWDALDVPLTEESESYVVRIVKDGVTLREEAVSVPAWTYDASSQVEDGLTAPYRFEVAQLSSVFGAGAFARLTVE